MGYVYKITNNVNGKVYIGKTCRTVEQRFKEHIRDAYNHKCNSKLHRAIRKYGKEHFSYVIVECCENDEDLSLKEQYYIKQYNSVYEGYNITFGGEGESQVDFEQIESLFNQGYNLKQISKITGHTSKTISTRLKAIGYEIPSNLTGRSGNKGKGISITFKGQSFPSLTLLATFLKANYDKFKDKKIETIIKGISKNSKRGTPYCGYMFYRS